MNGISNRKLFIIITVIVLFTACMPLFTLNCIGGHDITYHLLRIEALKTGIMSGRPFLRVNMLFFGGMGYASSLFYPDLLLYFPALLRVFGVGINLSYHLFVALCIILGFISSYYCGKHVSKSSYAALITAIIFTLYQYHLYDIYVRSAAGEYTAVIFVPFVIAGLYDLIYEDLRHPGFLFIGMAGVILCHTITAVICLVLCLASVIVDLRNIAECPKKMIRLFATALMTLGVTAFYWMSVCEMLSTGIFSTDFSFDAAYEAAKLWEIPFNEYNRMGAAVLLLLLSALLIREKERFADFCAVSGLIITVCATGVFPWERLSGVLGFMQFPWRLFVVTGPLLAFAEGIYLSRFASETKGGREQNGTGYVSRILLVIVTAVMLLSACGNFGNVKEEYYSYSDDYFDYLPFTAEVIGGEWLPTAASDREALLEQSDRAFTDNGTETGITRYKNELIAESIPQGTVYIDVPFVYYKGYAAENTETGEELTVTGEGRNGCVRVYTNGAGRVHVFYRGTLLQHIGTAISAGILIGIIIYFILRKKKVAGKDNNEE